MRILQHICAVELEYFLILSLYSQQVLDLKIGSGSETEQGVVTFCWADHPQCTVPPLL